MTDEMEGLDWASRMRVINFNDLIRGARACGFLDDVQHWEHQKTRFLAERLKSADPHSTGAAFQLERGDNAPTPQSAEPSQQEPTCEPDHTICLDCGLVHCRQCAPHQLADPSPIRCDYCGNDLPGIKHRSHIPTTPSLQRLGFAADKIVCPECATKARSEGPES